MYFLFFTLLIIYFYLFNDIGIYISYCISTIIKRKTEPSVVFHAAEI